MHHTVPADKLGSPQKHLFLKILSQYKALLKVCSLQWNLSKRLALSGKSTSWETHANFSQVDWEQLFLSSLQGPPSTEQLLINGPLSGHLLM